jgi:hypothetical protein
MSGIIKLFMIVFGIVLGVSLVGVPYFSSLFSLENKGEVKVRDQIIVVDIVKDPDTRAKGLGGRESLGVNEGMLFLFDEAAYYPFWMKDMKIPIDIVWISGNTIVGFDERVSPPPAGVSDSELSIYAPSSPVDKVLELAAGRVRLLRAEVGDMVKIRRLIAGGARLPTFSELKGMFGEWRAIQGDVKTYR